MVLYVVNFDETISPANFGPTIIILPLVTLPAPGTQ